MDNTVYFRRKTGGLAALLAFVGMGIAIVHSALFPPKPPPRNFGDGTYRNRDCGAITFRNGTMSFGSNEISYTLERRKTDISAVTLHLVAVEEDRTGCRVIYDPTSYGMYLPFEGNPVPKSVQLSGVSELASYNFFREPDANGSTKGSKSTSKGR
ncbi:hypothetical protein [Sphingomonas immobilis]|uniref:Transmembrane protein n=1 Tax=Sphingomonas immobilis TaxID=3063997 RepID=A0ABT9A1S3_9SPHN|nr:hypothetical protein [Sphingomonas sp. CA1-15]MDO7843779.1 hypothetical protein [Sphingomonas sp. CA1-15]